MDVKKLRELVNTGDINPIEAIETMLKDYLMVAVSDTEPEVKDGEIVLWINPSDLSAVRIVTKVGDTVHKYAISEETTTA